MKKIVALVLALVLALSLATVAFALTPVAGKVYVLNDDGTLDGPVEDSVTRVAAKAPTATERGNIAYYKGTATNMYVVEDKAEADYVLYTGTSYVYLDAAVCVHYNVNPGYALAYECPTTATCGKLTATNGIDAIVSKTDALGNVTYYQAAEPGDDIDTNTAVTYLFGNTLYYVYTNTGAASVADAVPHAWDVVTRNATTGAVETVGCTRCGAKGVIVTEADYNLLTAAQKGGTMNDGSYVKITSAAAAAEGVSSAKTFDAGVALYAGMALMSVAGSAVVIGKKKEF